MNIGEWFETWDSPLDGEPVLLRWRPDNPGQAAREHDRIAFGLLFLDERVSHPLLWDLRLRPWWDAA